MAAGYEDLNDHETLCLDQFRVNKLTQSIPAKTFRGELTAQWRVENPELISGENSAEVLLSRIRAEKGNMKPKPRHAVTH